MFSQLFGRIGWSDLPASFGYTLKECYDELPLSLFKLHHGESKVDKRPVTVFVFDKRSNKPAATALAQEAMRRAKRIRHPGFVNVHEAVSTASGVYIVTSEVRTLQAFVEDRSNKELFKGELPWNIKSLAEGLGFLHKEVQAVHGSIIPSSVFVAPSGQWFLGGFELCLEHSEGSPNSSARDWRRLYFEWKNVLDRSGSTESPEKYLPVSAVPESASAFAIDRHSFACLCAWAAASARVGRSVESYAFESNSRSLEPGLLRLCKRLTDSSTFNNDSFEWNNLTTRLTYFTEAPIVKIMDFLTRLALKGNWDKEIFFEQTLPTALDDPMLTPSIQTHMFLPFIVSEIGSAATPPSLQPHLLRLFIRMLPLIESQEVFDRVAATTFASLMVSNERVTRYLLLQSLPSYQQFITDQVGQELFGAVLTGLSDSSPEVRDVTLRAMLVFVPKVASQTGSFERVVRTMQKLLQGDSAPQIRTNVVICFARLIPSVPASQVLSSIAPNFLIGLRDGFSPCRLAALQGIGVLSPFMTPQYAAHHLLPALCPLLLDADPQCKELCFGVVEYLINFVKQHDPAEMPTNENSADTGFGSLPTAALSLLRMTAWGPPSGAPSPSEPPPVDLPLVKEPEEAQSWTESLQDLVDVDDAAAIGAAWADNTIDELLSPSEIAQAGRTDTLPCASADFAPPSDIPSSHTLSTVVQPDLQYPLDQSDIIKPSEEEFWATFNTHNPETSQSAPKPRKSLAMTLKKKTTTKAA